MPRSSTEGLHAQASPSSAFQVIQSAAGAEEDEEVDFPIMASDRGDERGGARLSRGMLLFGRVASLFLSLFFAAVLVYTIETDGSPFRSGVMTPWLATTIIDYYITGLPFYLWIVMRERSLVSGGTWALACICLGSVLVWFYVFLALMQTSAGTPLSSFVMGSAAASTASRAASTTARRDKNAGGSKSAGGGDDGQSRR